MMTSSDETQRKKIGRIPASYRRWKLRRAQRRLRRARSERIRLEEMYGEQDTVSIGAFLYEWGRFVWMQTVRWWFP